MTGGPGWSRRCPGGVTVLGSSVTVSGACVPAVDPGLESEVPGELDVLADTESVDVVDDEVPLYPASGRTRPAATARALLRSFASSTANE
jgi:hypothetical protein